MPPASRPVASLVELATVPGSASPWSPSPSAVARPQLLGHDLDGGSGAAGLGGPGVLLEPAATTRLPPLMTEPTSSGAPGTTRIGQRSKCLAVTVSDLLTIC